MKFYYYLLFAATLSCTSIHKSKVSDSPEKVRLYYNNPDLIVDLGVGLWANPIPVDWDLDGDTDLLVSTSDKPSNGLYFFENDGSNVFSPGKWIADGEKRMSVSWPGGKMTVCTPGIVYKDFREQLYNDPGEIAYKQEFYSGRANQWKYADYNGDGIFDLLIGVSDWREYGWDDAFNSDGNWTNGPLHGYVYWVKNYGSNQTPIYGKSQQILVHNKPLDVYGKPSPNLVYWDGDEDIISGNTAGFIEWIENLDGQFPPKWAAPERLETNGKTFRIMAGANMSIQGPAEAKWGYTVPYVADWNMDGLPDIILNSIVGKIIWLQNTGTLIQPALSDAQPVKVDWQEAPPKPEWNWWDPKPEEVVIQWRTRPIVLDLNLDGLNDLVVIDHEGYLSFFERKKRDDKLILLPGKRIFYDDKGKLLRLNPKKAGSSGRRKINLVDWDNDGDLDLLINSINTALYRNIGKNGEYIFQDFGDLSSVVLGGHSTSPTTVDWNGDGTRDLLIGAENGFFYYLPDKHLK